MAGTGEARKKGTAAFYFVAGGGIEPPTFGL